MSATLTDLLTAHGIAKHFGSREVLRGIDLSVPAQSITVILGTNGAGKTTLLRILGLLDPADAGTVTYDGIIAEGWSITYGAPLTGSAYDRRTLTLRRQMMLAFQHPVAFSGSVLSNVTYGLLLRGVGRAEAETGPWPLCAKPALTSVRTSMRRHFLVVSRRVCLLPGLLP